MLFLEQLGWRQYSTGLYSTKSEISTKAESASRTRVLEKVSPEREEQVYGR
jgi:hypothetical protein